MGWALITHPFHPLSGQRLPILLSRKVAGREILSLYHETSGSLPILRDWTDQALPSAQTGLQEPASVLDPGALLQLKDLVQTLKRKIDDE